MFFKKQKDNKEIVIADDYFNRTNNLISDFYKKCECIECDLNDFIYYNKRKLIEALKYFRKNIKDMTIGIQDFYSIQGIMQEFDKLYDAILETKSIEEKQYLTEKIIFISEFFCKNQVQSKKFESCKSLYLIFDLINNYWDDLKEKGVNLHSLLYPFCDFIQNQVYNGTPLSEEEKLKIFIGLINGTLKFQPVYKIYGYTVKPSDFNEDIIIRGNDVNKIHSTDIAFEINTDEGKAIIINK